MAGTNEPQNIETVTTAVSTKDQPDSKTRRYDRQLRLWAATGQSALESSSILVIGTSATSTSILKNLVLPGIGQFTILDHERVSSIDAGNNFFFEGQRSIGKSRAEEAVRLLGELNDQVKGTADTRVMKDLLDNEPEYFSQFSLVIAHNVQPVLVQRLASFLWKDPTYPPLMVVRSAGFMAEFFIQFHEHAIIESHSEASISLRIDKPFAALFDHALSLDFDNMDLIDHGHVPYIVILVRAMHDWKKSHDGQPPKTWPEKQEFKKFVRGMRRKADEENFDEAESQAYRAYAETKVPSEIARLFEDPALESLTPNSPPFYHLLKALHEFTLRPPHTLPLTGSLPDIHADTEKYIHLQKLYKAQAEEEKRVFKELLRKQEGGDKIDDEVVDSFVKNSHGILLLRGKEFGAFDKDREAIKGSFLALPKPSLIHLGFSALSSWIEKPTGEVPTVEELTSHIKTATGPGVDLPNELNDVVGEICRSPTADLPNVAAFLGGMVAQEAIKIITKQYVPQRGYLAVDMVDMSTAPVDA